MKKHSKLLTVLAIIVVALVAGGLWWLLMGSNKADPKDYASAQKAYQDTRASYLEYEKAFNTYSDGDYTSATNKAAYEKAQDDYQAKVAKLKSAVDALKDSDVSDKYQTFAAQSKAFEGYASGYADDYAVALSLPSADCLKPGLPAVEASDVVATFDARVKQCQADIDTLKHSSNAGLSNFGKALEQTLRNRRAALVAVAAKVKTSDAAGTQAAITKLVAIGTPELTKSIAEARVKLTVQKALDAFGKTLSDKTPAA